MNQTVTAIDTLRHKKKKKHPERGHIDDALDLFENKLIDSINFVEYILMIEELADCEIPVTADLVSRTATLERVRIHFLD